MADQHAERVRVHVDTSGISVSLDGRDVAALAWVFDMDVERWAEDFAAAIRRHIDDIDGRDDAS